MTMNSEGSKTWQRMTKENLGKSIAIVLDGACSFIPNRSKRNIGRPFKYYRFESIEEAKDLANILKSGKMPAPARLSRKKLLALRWGKNQSIQECIHFIVAFIMVLIYMLFFYSKKAGLAANVALFANLFFLFGSISFVRSGSYIAGYCRYCFNHGYGC